MRGKTSAMTYPTWLSRKKRKENHERWNSNPKFVFFFFFLEMTSLIFINFRPDGDLYNC